MSSTMTEERRRARWRQVAHEVIFESDTRAGRAFNVALFIVIVASVLVVTLESVQSIRRDHAPLLRTVEWVFTAVFTVEYALRLASVDRPLRYATSFFGLVDLLSIVPSYASLLLPGAQAMLAIRALRLLRVFRVLKLGHYLDEAQQLRAALRASGRKITVFLGAVVTIVVIMGAVMYFVEGAESGFTSIPVSIYWAVVTMTTVGYGDIAPQTWIGQTLAALLMIAGYGIIAVPTGIVSVELAQVRGKLVSTQVCPSCAAEGHDPDARHCKYCGAPL
jgi:voltage-gated potassium channel